MVTFGNVVVSHDGARILLSRSRKLNPVKDMLPKDSRVTLGRHVLDQRARDRAAGDLPPPDASGYGPLLEGAWT
jgi:hypothetical protein